MNLDKQTIEVLCPGCSFYNKIFFKQARLRDVIICRGCKSNIQLDDQLNECRKAGRVFRRLMQDMKRLFQNRTINIKI